MTEKMTYVKALDSVLSTATLSDEVREKLDALKVSLEKRAASKSTKPTKAQREAGEFAESVFATLSEIAEAKRCGEIAEVLGVSGQKVSAALSKLVKAGRVEKFEGEKKASYFKVIA